MVSARLGEKRKPGPRGLLPSAHSLYFQRRQSCVPSSFSEPRQALGWKWFSFMGTDPTQACRKSDLHRGLIPMSDDFCLALWHLLLVILVAIHETQAILEFNSHLGAVIKLRGQETCQSPLSLRQVCGDRILFFPGAQPGRLAIFRALTSSEC